MMHQSSDILILYDVPSRHAVEHRTMSLLLEKSATDLSLQKQKHFFATKNRSQFFAAKSRSQKRLFQAERSPKESIKERRFGQN